MSTENFTRERFHTLAMMQRNHFWHAGRQAMISNALDEQFSVPVELAADIGCGPGMQLTAWKKYAKQVVGLDQYANEIDPAFFEEAIKLISGDVAELPFDDNSIDLVLTLDLLEHVPDAAALKEIMRVLKSGGVLLVTVPAFQWLWSYRDENAGHMRRYSKKAIKKAIEQSGLKVDRMRYYQFFLFPLVALSRLFGRKTRDVEDFPPRFLNTIFKKINLFEAMLDKFGVSMPTGSSIIVLAMKP